MKTSCKVLKGYTPPKTSVIYSPSSCC